eukprot:755264-Hanusia_phi.AAC.1
MARTDVSDDRTDLLIQVEGAHRLDHIRQSSDTKHGQIIENQLRDYAHKLLKVFHDPVPGKKTTRVSE